MKPIFTLPVHSCVSLITNSSSELFICGREKTAEMIKASISALYKEFCENYEKGETEYGIPGPEDLWVSVLREPEVAKWAFKQTKETRALEEMDLSSWTEPLYKKEYKASDALKAKFMKAGKNPEYKEGKPIDKAAQEAFYEATRKLRKKIWQDYGKEKQKREYSAFCSFLEANKLSPGQFPALATTDGRYSGLFPHEKLTKRQSECLTFFHQCLSYGMVIQKGDILLYSQGDNSVPWEFMEVIESVLGAGRYHLG